ncbi:MAG: PfkB family carbohydrate kinase [Bacteroidales bacterium]|nr:PfkB family carbohydrate kinase [Bacteroidales bacterium]
MIYTLGETVIDLIFKNMQPQSAKVGGSALNTSVTLGRLGDSVSFISEVGNDDFGNWCLSFLRENGVSTDYVVCYENKKTSLALAFLNEKNDAKYQFYKEFSESLTANDSTLCSKDYLLLSSSFSLNERVRGAVRSMLRKAMDANVVVLYDPNMRKPLSKTGKSYDFLKENLTAADISHISDEDGIAMFGAKTSDEVYECLKEWNVPVLVYTQNSREVVVKTPLFTKEYAVPEIKVVSTIGAGDTFNAGLLHMLHKYGIRKDQIKTISENFFDEAIPFAIRCAGAVCQSMDNYVPKEFVKSL